MANVKFLKTTSALWGGLTKDSNAFYYVDDKDLYLGEIKLSNGEDLAAAISRVAENEADILQLQKDLGALTGGEGSGTISEMIAAAIKDEEDRALAAEDALDQKIDGEISRAQGAESALDTKITTLQGLVDNLSGTVEGNETDIEAKFGTLNETVSGHTTSIGQNTEAINAEVLRATGAEEGLAERIKVVEDDYLTSTDKTELQGNIDSLTGVVEALRDGVDAEKVDGVIDLINYVEEHGPEVTGMKQDISKNAEDIAGLAGRMTTAEGKISAAEEDIAALEPTVAGHTTSIENLTGAVEAINNTDTGILAQAKTYTDGEIDKIEQTIQTNQASDSDARAALQEQITANANAIAGINNETTGILAQAKKYTDDEIAALALGTASQKDVEYFEVAGAASAAQAAAKTYTDGEIEKVNGSIQTLDTALTWQTISA